MDYNGDDVQAHLRERLEGFPFYDPEHHVGVTIGDSAYIGYALTSSRQNNVSNTRFDIQVQKDECYILGFNLEEFYRGLRYGSDLVRVLVEFSSEEFGVNRFLTTP